MIELNLINNKIKYLWEENLISVFNACRANITSLNLELEIFNKLPNMIIKASDLRLVLNLFQAISTYYVNAKESNKRDEYEKFISEHDPCLLNIIERYSRLGEPNFTQIKKMIGELINAIPPDNAFNILSAFTQKKDRNLFFRILLLSDLSGNLLLMFANKIIT